MVTEPSFSTRPTKREIPLVVVEVPVAPDSTRGACSSRVGMRRMNEVCGEIVLTDPE